MGWRARFCFVPFWDTRLETPNAVSENELPEISQRRGAKSVESGLSRPIRGPRRLFRRSARAETAPSRARGRGRPGSTASTPCIIRSQHFGLDVVKRGQPEVARTVNYESRSSLARNLNDALEPPEPFGSRRAHGMSDGPSVTITLFAAPTPRPTRAAVEFGPPDVGDVLGDQSGVK